MKTMSMEDEEKFMKAEQNKKNTLPRPSLLKRVWAALIDIILIALIFFGLETACYYTIFQPLGYFDAIDEAHQLFEESHLYRKSEAGEYILLNAVYDEELTPEENYDGAITYFYSTYPYAIENDALSAYTDAKLATGYYEMNENGEFIRKTDASVEQVKLFLEKEYSDAVSFFTSSPAYVTVTNRSLRILLISALIVITFSSACIYLFIPLICKEGETPGQLLNKICLVDSRDQSQVKKRQILIRYIILLGFDILLPICFYIQWGYFSVFSIFITIVMISVTKSNSGPHDYISRTYVILKKRFDNFDLLKSVRGEKQ